MKLHVQSFDILDWKLYTCYELNMKFFKSNRKEVFCKDGVLKIFAKFIGKRLCWSLFLTKPQARGQQLYWKEISAQVFSSGFAKFWRTLPGVPPVAASCFYEFYKFICKFFWVRSHSLITYEKKKIKVFTLPPCGYATVHFGTYPPFLPIIGYTKWFIVIYSLSFTFILKKWHWLKRLVLSHTTIVKKILHIY